VTTRGSIEPHRDGICRGTCPNGRGVLIVAGVEPAGGLGPA
jgi:hypothetical protein